ncbi:MAG TPA: ribbon-helix-helix domain-containing protein [archaeon]|nr:ribbon-helix-helix domain-containing protein [archaeon]
MASKSLAIKNLARTVGTKMTATEFEKMQALVDAGLYLNVSDFIRDAVREKLGSIEIIKLRDVDYKIAKKEVLAYFEKFREAYPDEAANDLSLSLEMVAKITSELIKEKRLEAIN